MVNVDLVHSGSSDVDEVGVASSMTESAPAVCHLAIDRIDGRLSRDTRALAEVVNTEPDGWICYEISPSYRERCDGEQLECMHD